MEDKDNKWFFTKEQLENTPSRKCGMDATRELLCRQQCAKFIQDIGQKLSVNLLCINTAIVYMHRFYMFHSFTKIHRNSIAPVALFLAAKVEEQPRKLHYVVKVAQKCLTKDELQDNSEALLSKSNDLVYLENVMLQTLGFDIAIDHPHTYVIKLIHIVKARTELGHTAYFMATNSLHLTTMCLQYRPSIVACVCIHLACKWSNYKIGPCAEGNEWYYYVDKSVTPELLEELTNDFLVVLEKSPNRLSRRVIAGYCGGLDITKDGPSHPKLDGGGESASHSKAQAPVENHARTVEKESSPTPSASVAADLQECKQSFAEQLESMPSSSFLDVFHLPSPLKKAKSETTHAISLAVYREKREKERLNEQKERQTDWKEPVPEQKISLPIPDLPLAPPPPLIQQPLDAPIIPSLPALPVFNTVEKHSADIKHEKRTLVSVTSSSESILQNEKPHHKPVPPTSASFNHETTSAPKMNHQVLTPPVSSVHNGQSVPVPKTDNAPKKNTLTRKKSDPFVLLTRVDQQSEKKNTESAKPGHPSSAPKPNTNSNPHNKDPKVKPNAHISVVTTNACDVKLDNVAKLPSSTKLKPPKQKTSTPVPHNNHAIVSDSHVKPELLNQSWGALTNSTKASQQLPANMLRQPVEEQRIPDKINENLIKHEKREKHKHKHSLHTSKEKSSHVSGSPADMPTPSSIKITIPKDKIGLSGIRPDSSQKSHNSIKEESPRTTSLKIKIPKPKLSTPETVSEVVKAPGLGIKLVITKDKNAGSYSASSRKAERSSRKRDRSPGFHSSHSSSKSSKVSKLDQVAYKGLHNDISQNHTRTVADHNSLHSSDNIATQSFKQSNANAGYHQNSVNEQTHLMQYNTQPYYQQQQSYYPYPISLNGPYNHVQPTVPPPPLPPLPPPLPKDPPPPLPPQPPLPS